MTHIENIPHILQYGITHVNSPNTNPAFKPIGDRSLINTRNSKRIPNGRTLGEYIPFYFAKRTPMLYVVQKGYNSLESILPQNIVYCITTVQEIIDHKLDFIFTDGHAVNDLTDFYDQKSIGNIDSIIDKDAINATFWNETKDTDLKRRKEAEFLISNDIPISAIKGYAVYNETARQQLLGYGIPEALVVVRNNFYF